MAASNARIAGLLAVAAAVLAACGSATTGSSAAPPTTAPPTTVSAAGSTTTAAAVTTGTATCPTLAQANAALGGSYSGPIQTPAGGNGVVCEYTSSAGNAGVTIFAHQTSVVYAGQVANATGRVAGMQKVAGVGDGAYALTTGGRTVLNAYSNGSRTVVAAQAPGALGPTEALARVALADN